MDDEPSAPLTPLTVPSAAAPKPRSSRRLSSERPENDTHPLHPSRDTVEPTLHQRSEFSLEQLPQNPLPHHHLLQSSAPRHGHARFSQAEPNMETLSAYASRESMDLLSAGPPHNAPVVGIVSTAALSGLAGFGEGRSGPQQSRRSEHVTVSRTFGSVSDAQVPGIDSSVATTTSGTNGGSAESSIETTLSLLHRAGSPKATSIESGGMNNENFEDHELRRPSLPPVATEVPHAADDEDQARRLVAGISQTQRRSSRHSSSRERAKKASDGSASSGARSVGSHRSRSGHQRMDDHPRRSSSSVKSRSSSNAGSRPTNGVGELTDQDKRVPGSADNSKRLGTAALPIPFHGMEALRGLGMDPTRRRGRHRGPAFNVDVDSDATDEDTIGVDASPASDNRSSDEVSHSPLELLRQKSDNGSSSDKDREDPTETLRLSKQMARELQKIERITYAESMPAGAAMLPAPTHRHKVAEAQQQQQRQQQQQEREAEERRAAMAAAQRGISRPTDCDSGLPSIPQLVPAFGQGRRSADVGARAPAGRERELSLMSDTSIPAVSTSSVLAAASEINVERLHEIAEIEEHTFDKHPTLLYERQEVENAYLHFVLQYEESRTYLFLSSITILAFVCAIVASGSLWRMETAAARNEMAIYLTLGSVSLTLTMGLLVVRYIIKSSTRNDFLRLSVLAVRIALVSYSALTPVALSYSSIACRPDRFFLVGNVTRPSAGKSPFSPHEDACPAFVSPVLPCVFVIALTHSLPRFVELAASLLISGVAYIISYFVVRQPQSSSGPFVQLLLTHTTMFLAFIAMRLNLEQRSRARFEAIKAFTIEAKAVGEQRASLNKLVQELFPPVLAFRLIKGGGQWLDRERNATCVVITVGDFHQFSVSMLGGQLASEIAILHRSLSAIADAHRVQRIRAVGETFYASSNLLLPNARHATACTAFAINAVDALSDRFGLVAGVHSGDLIGSVVGAAHVRYDMQGEALNGARGLATHCVVGDVLVSAATKRSVIHPKIAFIEFGSVSIGHISMEAFSARATDRPGGDGSESHSSTPVGSEENGSLQGDPRYDGLAALLTGSVEDRRSFSDSRAGCSGGAFSAAITSMNSGSTKSSPTQRSQEDFPGAGHQRAVAATRRPSRLIGDGDTSSRGDGSIEFPAVAPPPPPPPLSDTVGTSASMAKTFSLPHPPAREQQLLSPMSRRSPRRQSVAATAAWANNRGNRRRNDVDRSRQVLLSDPLDELLLSATANGISDTVFNHFTTWDHTKLPDAVSGDAASTSLPILAVKNPLSRDSAASPESDSRHRAVGIAADNHHGPLPRPRGSTISPGESASHEWGSVQSSGAVAPATGLVAADARHPPSQQQGDGNMPSSRFVKAMESRGAFLLRKHHLIFKRFESNALENQYQANRDEATCDVAPMIFAPTFVLAGLTFLRYDYPSGNEFSEPHCILAIAVMVSSAALIFVTARPATTVHVKVLLLQIGCFVIPLLFLTMLHAANPSPMAYNLLWYYPFAYLTMIHSSWAVDGRYVGLRSVFEIVFIVISLFAGNRQLDKRYIAFVVLFFIVKPFVLSNSDVAARRAFVAHQSISLLVQRRNKEDAVRRGILLATLPPRVFDLVSNGYRGPEEIPDVVAVQLLFFSSFDAPGFLNLALSDGAPIRDIIEPIEGVVTAEGAVLCVVKLFGDVVGLAGPISRVGRSRDEQSRDVMQAIIDTVAVFSALLHRCSVPVVAAAHIGSAFTIISASKYPTFDIVGQAMSTAQHIANAGVPGNLVVTQNFLRTGADVANRTAAELGVMFTDAEPWRIRATGLVRVHKLIARKGTPRLQRAGNPRTPIAHGAIREAAGSQVGGDAASPGDPRAATASRSVPIPTERIGVESLLS